MIIAHIGLITERHMNIDCHAADDSRVTFA